MPFISTSEHQKFISQCDRLINNCENERLVIPDESSIPLMNDMAELQKIAEEYQDKLSQLFELTARYHILQRQIRVNIRKKQLEKNNKS